MTNHPSRKKVFVDTTFQQKMRERGYGCALLWEAPGPKDTRIAWMSCYAVGRRMCIVQTFQAGGWEVFTSSAIASIDGTIDKVIDRIREAKPAPLALTPEQYKLARHALGLPNEHKRSYRNRFVAGPDHPAYAAWQAMIAHGAAFQDDEARNLMRDSMLFGLTKAGAEAALDPGESLDPEDFA